MLITKSIHMRGTSWFMVALFGLSLLAVSAMGLIQSNVVHAAAFNVQREQSAFDDGNPPTATFGSTPGEGNLLVAIAFSRSGASTTTHSISGSDWVKRVAHDAELANSGARRALSIWSKTAGAAEPTGVTVSGDSGSVKLLIQEFSNTAGEMSFLGAASNDNGANTDETSLASGSTAAFSGNQLLVSALGIRNASGTNINSANWDTVGDTVHSNGGSNSRTVNSGYALNTMAGAKASTADWAGKNTGASAGLLVFQVPDMCMLPAQSGRIIVDFAPYNFIRSDTSANAATKGPVATAIPAGDYTVTLQSYDGHDPKAATQPNEGWFLILEDAGNTTVAQSSAISDLPDGDMFRTEVVDAELSVADDATQATAFHSVYPDASSPNSIHPVCAALDPVVEDEPEEEAEVLGTTQVEATPVGGVNAGGGGTPLSTSALFGLMASLGVLAYGAWRVRKDLGTNS